MTLAEAEERQHQQSHQIAELGEQMCEFGYEGGETRVCASGYSVRLVWARTAAAASAARLVLAQAGSGPGQTDFHL